MSSYLLDTTLAFAAAMQGALRVLSLLTLSRVYDFKGLDSEMLEVLGRALESEPVFYLSGASLSVKFRALAIRGHAEAVQLLRHPSVSMPVLGRPNRTGSWWALTHAVEGLAALGRWEEAAALRDSTEELLLTGAKSVYGLSTQTAAGIAAACARDWSRAQDHHRAAIHDADTVPMRIQQPMTRAWYAELLAMQGDLAQARVMLSEALALYESIGMSGYARRASERLATL